MSKTKIIPCSGIGKVHGSIAREAAFEIIRRENEKCETMCLAHIVTGDVDIKEKIENEKCITIDGCPALCAAKNVELAGGIVEQSIRVIDEMKKHRGAKPGTATYLTEDGWKMVDNIASNICENLRASSLEVD
ncbi:putative zinc-binding protein [Clostridioides difficile]|uniref:putative zinc-binding protein n=1 Tax=Clostridioides sp. ZZV15-6598 TaxID=2811501 RepID=UPI001D1163B2|nr:hypothetical protein [Clostridioides sp. ZZV15-6598]